MPCAGEKEEEETVLDKLEEFEQGVSSIFEDSVDFDTLNTVLFGRDYLWFGRAEVDGALYSGSAFSGEDGFELRRLRVGIMGLAHFVDRLSYKVEFDITDGTNNISDP